MTRRSTATALATGIALALGVAGCGAGGQGSRSPGGADVNFQVPKDAKRGGTLTLLSESDIDSPDPGLTYEQFSFAVFGVLDRPLYQYLPPDYDRAVPDVAASAPEISPDARTVTVKLKPGIRFSPPVNREATSRDVKYAIERGFSANVPNPYVSSYFSSIQGAPEPGSGPPRPIEGILTPDDRTVVFRLAEPLGGLVAQALVLPLTAPVPPEYARRFDLQRPSTYPEHQVATGPYMIENDRRTGKVTGYSPGRSLVLVRNPNWDAATDDRPAYADRIDIREGITNPISASRKILAGRGLITGNVVPPPQILKQVVGSSQDEQLALSPSGGIRYVSMNTRVKPFDDLNVRKAVIACMDRDQLRLTRGGRLVGDIASHQLPPELPGGEVGGREGFGFDWLTRPAGDPAVCRKYLRAAGYPGGRYTGGQPLLLVADNSGVPARTAQVVRAQFEKMGFKINYKAVAFDVMNQRFCGVPRQRVAICPNVGFFKDFQDAQTLLDPTFNGDNILPVGNSNWSELDDPQINAAMDRAARLTDPAQRAKAFGEIDRMITAQAPVIPWIWDKQPLLRSRDVKSVANQYSSSWDLAFTAVG